MFTSVQSVVYFVRVVPMSILFPSFASLSKKSVLVFCAQYQYEHLICHWVLTLTSFRSIVDKLEFDVLFLIELCSVLEKLECLKKIVLCQTYVSVAVDEFSSTYCHFHLFLSPFPPSVPFSSVVKLVQAVPMSIILSLSRCRTFC